MSKIIKIVAVVLLVVAVGWAIPKLSIKDTTGFLDEHIVSERLAQTLNRPVDKFLLLQTKVSSGEMIFNTSSAIYVDAYTWFGIKYAAVKLDCLKGMFYSGCAGVIVK